MSTTEQRTAAATPAAVWVALGIVYVVWGSTYLGIKLAVKTIPPFVMGGARFVLAGVLLYAIVRLRGGGRHLTRRELLSCALVGTLLAAGGNGIVNVAEQYINSGLAALIISSVPLWVVLMRRISGERVSPTTLFSVLIGFCGVGLLLAPGGTGGGDNYVLGFALVVLASLSWAFGSFISRSLPLPNDPLFSTSLQMTAGGLVLSAAAVVSGEAADVDPSTFSTESIAAFAYLVLVGSLVAYTAYVYLLRNAPISRAATYAYVNPTIAIFLGWLVNSEQVTGLMLAGAAIVISSVAITVRNETG